MTQAWYNKRTASAAVFFLLQLSLFSPTVVAAVAQGIGRSHHRHSNVVLNIVLPWLWEVARSGVQDSGNIQNLSGVLTCLDSYPPEPNKRSGIARYRKMVDKC